MTLVVDASVIVGALTLQDRVGAWCERQLATPALQAPHHVGAEVANSLRRRVAAGDLPAAAAAALLADFLELQVQPYSFEPFAERVWELRATITAYDAWYVALAEAHGCALATLDRRLVRAPGPRCGFVTPD